MRIEISATGAAVAAHSPRTRRIDWLSKHLPDAEDQREYAREKCIEAVSAALDSLSAHMTQTALAAKLGRTPSYVSKMLSGAHNMTLHSLGDLLWACDAELRWDDDQRSLVVGELGIVHVPIDDSDRWNRVTSVPAEPRSTTLVLQLIN